MVALAVAHVETLNGTIDRTGASYRILPLAVHP